MGKPLDVMQLHNTGSPFDGMGSTKYCTQYVSVTVALFHSQQTIFHGRQLLTGFLDEHAENFFHERLLV